MSFLFRKLTWKQCLFPGMQHCSCNFCIAKWFYIWFGCYPVSPHISMYFRGECGLWPRDKQAIMSCCCCCCCNNSVQIQKLKRVKLIKLSTNRNQVFAGTRHTSSIFFCLWYIASSHMRCDLRPRRIILILDHQWGKYTRDFVCKNPEG